MNIRKARKDDVAEITQGLMLAMEDIVYEFIKEKNASKARDFFLHLVQREDNQYSYRNCFVAEKDGSVIGVTNIYDGALLHTLRTPVVEYIRSIHGHTIQPEDETMPGEFYIDCIGVLPGQQGKGIGSGLLQFAKEEFVEKRKMPLGLLVDKENPGAKKLYIKHGFEPVGVKTLMGKNMEHLQLKPLA